MKRPNIYVQRQSGGNCRLHALNGYFGYEKITQPMWHTLVLEYDKMSKYRYNSNTSTHQYDVINSGGQTIVSWVLMIHGVYAKYIPQSFMKTQQIYEAVNNNKSWVFMFNSDHIWGIRYYEPHQQWFKVDSMSGISSFDIDSIASDSNKYGMIIPMLPRPELISISKQISEIIANNHTSNYRAAEQPSSHRAASLCERPKVAAELQQVCDKSGVTNATNLWCDTSLQTAHDCSGAYNYVLQSQHRGNIIGELEVLIANAFTCLDAQLHKNNNSAEFANIRACVDKWYKFLSIWTNGNYNNVKLTLEHIPEFITMINNLY